MEYDLGLKDKIIKKAGELFLTQGYNATTIRQIADQVEMGRGHLYYYFKRKEDILLFLLIDMVQEIRERAIYRTEIEDDIFGAYILNEYIYLLVVRSIPRLEQIYKEASKIQLLRNEHFKMANDNFMNYVKQSSLAFPEESIYLSSILASVAEFELMELEYDVELIVEAVVRTRFSCLNVEQLQIDGSLTRVEKLYHSESIRKQVREQADLLLEKYNIQRHA